MEMGVSLLLWALSITVILSLYEAGIYGVRLHRQSPHYHPPTLKKHHYYLRQAYLAAFFAILVVLGAVTGLHLQRIPLFWHVHLPLDIIFLISSLLAGYYHGKKNPRLHRYFAFTAIGSGIISVILGAILSGKLIWPRF